MQPLCSIFSKGVGKYVHIFKVLQDPALTCLSSIIGQGLCSLCSSHSELLTASRICQTVSGFHVFIHTTPLAFPLPTSHSRLSFYKVILVPSLGRTGDSFLSVPSGSCLNFITRSVTLYWIYLLTLMPLLLDYQPFDIRHYFSLISVLTDYVKLCTQHLISIQ